MRIVPVRLLRRVIRKHRGIGGFGREVPHEDAYALDAGALANLAPELALATEGGVVLLLAEREPPETPVERWRRVYGLRVFAAALELQRGGTLTASLARERFHRLGQVETDEIRSTLRKDGLLLPPLRGETREEITFICFAAHWALLSALHRDGLQRAFPTLARRRDEVDALVAELLPTAELLAASRPEGASAPDPEDRVETGTEEDGGRTEAVVDSSSRDALIGDAAGARARGNLVRAALRSHRAIGSADGDLVTLGVRLDAVLGSGPGAGNSGPSPWRDALAPLLPHARSLFAVETRLLFDLQRACLDHEREVHRVDLVEWALSLFKRPIRRALPALREVRVVKHLRRALHKVARTRLREAPRARLHERLRDALATREEHLRARLTPVVHAALTAAVPAASRVGKLALDKGAAELCDRIVEKGSLSFPFVRDAIARNDAKLDDLRGPRDFLGDPLLRIDHQLAAPLEGVYRRAELYRRWLQRLSALGFATTVGRVFVRFALLPVVGAYLVLEGLQHTVLLAVNKLAQVKVHVVSTPALVGVGLLVLGLVNSAAVRHAALIALRGLWRALRFTFYDVWRALLALELVRRLRESEPWRVFIAWVVAPMLFSAPFALPILLIEALALETPARVAVAGAIFAGFVVLLRSPAGLRLEEALTDAAVRARRFFAYRFFPALLASILGFFRALVDGLERVLYAVDELLRFRPGDRTPSIAIKAALGLPWSGLTYVLRLYVNVLLEPKYNPVKHFPVVTVAHKIILPVSLSLTETLSQPLIPLVGSAAATGIAGTTVFLSPGLFGFLAWELKENWRLYARNRPALIEPSVVGGHGETVARLLRPGFHSGTLPKLYGKLRRVARRTDGPGRDRAVHRLEERLHHVEVELRRFVARELTPLIAREVGAIELGSNRVRIHLARGVEPSDLMLSLEEQSGRLVGHATFGGALAKDAEVSAALEGFWRKAGIDVLRDDIERLLPPGTRYDLADEGLVAWPGADHHAEVVYSLEGEAPLLSPRVERDGDGARSLGLIARDALFLGKRPLAFHTWVATWR